MTPLLLIALLLQSPPPRNCQAVVAATKHRQAAFANCMTAIGISDECHRRADGVFEERLATMHAFAECDREIEVAEKGFEMEAKDNGFPLWQGLKRLFKMNGGK